MRSTICFLLGAVALMGMPAAQSLAQAPVITLFQGNGQLSWTNAVNSNAVYRVRRAEQLGQPFSFPFATEAAYGRSGFTVTGEVDGATAFYRVEMFTNWPSGLVWVDGGDVELGDPSVSAPLHTNFVSGFWIGATEVTKEQWDAVASWAAANGYDISVASGDGKTNNHPVQAVSWYECVKWCNARSQKEGLAPCYYVSSNFAPKNLYTASMVDVSNSWVNWGANGYRLPTEAEWEKAARGGRQRNFFPWGGDTISHSQANYCSSTIGTYDISPTKGCHPSYTNTPAPFTSPVASFPANGYGLYDVAGNVYEWCWDWYGDYVISHQVDPHGPDVGQSEATRIMRGGSWFDFANSMFCGARRPAVPASEGYYYGFRCARGAGRPGYALSFSGSASVSVAHRAALNAYPLTVTAWVLTSRNDTTYRGLACKGVVPDGYALTIYGGHVRAAYGRSVTQYVPLLDGGAVADGLWHHVAFVVDASGGKLYVDGQLGDSQPWTGSAGACTTSQNLLLGRYSGDSSLLGTLDEVAIWSIARSAAQIQASMRQSLSGTETGHLGYWRMDDGAGATASNSAATGIGYNGALQNGPAWVYSGVTFTP